jgi:hypothetical protein
MNPNSPLSKMRTSTGLRTLLSQVVIMLPLYRPGLSGPPGLMPLTAGGRGLELEPAILVDGRELFQLHDLAHGLHGRVLVTIHGVHRVAHERRHAGGLAINADGREHDEAFTIGIIAE